MGDAIGSPLAKRVDAVERALKDLGVEKETVNQIQETAGTV